MAAVDKGTFGKTAYVFLPAVGLEFIASGQSFELVTALLTEDDERASAGDIVLKNSSKLGRGVEAEKAARGDE